MTDPRTAVTVVEQPADAGIAAIWRSVLARRFWQHVDLSGGPVACWPWQGGRTTGGYGVFSRGRRGTHVRANRFALELGLGRPLAPGMYACHSCDNPPCCNPSHLFEGTQQDNLRDAAAKGRTALQRHPELARGERNSQARLTESDVAELRAAARIAPMRDVALRFEVSLSHAYRVVSGETWPHTFKGAPR